MEGEGGKGGRPWRFDRYMAQELRATRSIRALGPHKNIVTIERVGTTGRCIILIHHSVDTPSDHGGGVLVGVVEYTGLLPIRDDPHEGLDDGHRRRFLAGLTLMPYIGHNSFYNLMAKSKQASVQAVALFDPVRTFVHRPFSSDHPMRHTSYLLVRCSTPLNSGPSSRSRARSAKG